MVLAINSQLVVAQNSTEVKMPTMGEVWDTVSETLVGTIPAGLVPVAQDITSCGGRIFPAGGYRPTLVLRGQSYETAKKYAFHVIGHLDRNYPGSCGIISIETSNGFRWTGGGHYKTGILYQGRPIDDLGLIKPKSFTFTQIIPEGIDLSGEKWDTTTMAIRQDVDERLRKKGIPVIVSYIDKVDCDEDDCVPTSWRIEIIVDRNVNLVEEFSRAIDTEESIKETIAQVIIDSTKPLNVSSILQ